LRDYGRPQPTADTAKSKKATGKVVDIMAKSLPTITGANAERRPAGSQTATGRKSRQRKA